LPAHAAGADLCGRGRRDNAGADDNPLIRVLSGDDLGGDLVAAANAKLPKGAEQLRQAGIPGIKYYDAQSRGGQQATTQNFVVFPGNEELLKILERNGGLLD